jgi:hypothetical protein
MFGERASPGKRYSQAPDRPMRSPMRRRAGRHRGTAAAALLALALAIASPAARADEAPAAPDPTSPIANGPVPDAKAPPSRYQVVGPSERRGRTLELDEVEADAGEAQPATGGGDPNDFPGEARTLDELSRPPGPTRKKADWELEDVPGPLKIRRLPSERPPPDAPLLVRLCDADESRAFAERELRDAVRAYKRARRGEYPRGRDKWLVIERREIAVRRVARADADWEAVLGEAEAEHVEFDASECP